MDILFGFSEQANGIRFNDQETLRIQARQIVERMRRSWPLNQQALSKLVKDLPTLSEHDLQSLGHHDGQCPICFIPFLALLAEEEIAQAMDSPAHPVEELGVTRLEATCGHLFCRRDISKWIQTNHDSCPTCRTPFLSPSSVDARPIESVPDSEISESLLLLEQMINGELEGLRTFRETVHAERPVPTADDDEHGGASTPVEEEDGSETTHSRPTDPPSSRSSTNRTRPRDISDGYMSMYS